MECKPKFPIGTMLDQTVGFGRCKYVKPRATQNLVILTNLAHEDFGVKLEKKMIIIVRFKRPKMATRLD